MAVTEPQVQAAFDSTDGIVPPSAARAALVHALTPLFNGGDPSSDHNLLSGLQGGAAGDYQHLTTAQVSAFASKEPSLGNPSVSGHILSSTTAGVRSWVAPYALPTASASILGGVKVGTGLAIASGVLSVAYGSSAGTACQGNDSRLSDARAPTAHTHSATDISGILSVNLTGFSVGINESINSSMTILAAFGAAQGQINARLTTVTADTASRAANTVYAAPNGSAGTATFRSLVPADIPSLDAAKLTSGTLGYARGGTGISAPGATAGNLRWSGSAFAIDTASYALSSSIPAASSTTPAALGTAAVGTGTTWARADHVHALPTAAQVGAAASGHNHTLDSLSNVTISSNSAGEILRWNGTAWVNATLAEAGIQPAGSYLTGNQTITLSGIVTGSGATAITTSIADAALSIAKTNGLQTSLDGKVSISLSRVTDGTYVSSTVDAMSLSARHAAGYGTHFGRWYNIAEAPRTGYFSYVMLPETKTGAVHTTFAMSNTDAIEGYIGRGSPTTTETWRRIWTSGDFSSTNVSHWDSAYSWGDHASAGYMLAASYPDLVAIEALAGTSGFLKKTAANTWSLDTSAYLTTTGTAAAATKLATARTLTIGATGKTFDGTANVAWTLAEIGAVASGYAVVKNPTAEQKITSYALVVERSFPSQAAFAAWIAGDVVGRVSLQSDGSIEWGSGAAIRDTRLYRAAADLLKTDDVFLAAGGFRSTGDNYTPIYGTGPGIEVHYEAGNSRARVLAYDRTAAARIPLAIDGSPINFYANGVLKGSFDASGNFNLVNLTASRMVSTDASKNLVTLDAAGSRALIGAAASSDLPVRIHYMVTSTPGPSEWTLGTFNITRSFLEVFGYANGDASSELRIYSGAQLAYSVAISPSQMFHVRIELFTGGGGFVFFNNGAPAYFSCDSSINPLSVRTFGATDYIVFRKIIY